MNLIIRSENYRDYPEIADINQLAFRDASGGLTREVLFVDSLRHRREYDPELALVAELAGRVVGYALYSPCELYFNNEPVKAVVLAPLCIHPDWQRQGIGASLLEAGHRIAKQKGYSCCLLYGVKDYYPRFGYQTGMFSSKGLQIDRADLPTVMAEVVERRVEPADIPQIVSIWRKWHQDEPIAMFPGSSLMDWVSHAQGIRASSVMIDGRLAGYLRYRIDRVFAPLSFIAESAAATSAMLGYLGEKAKGSEDSSIHLPSNPASQLIKELIPYPFASEVRMSVHAMIKVLDQTKASLVAYCDNIEQNSGQAVLNLPAQFEWA